VIRGEVFARWRVRTGYLVAIVVLLMAHPTPFSILLGGVTGFLGLGIRAYAAGHLHKQEVLTRTGPYAYTRNPLYLGSAILALGAGIATRSVWSCAILLVYFAVFYSVVMRREESELRQKHGPAFEEYATSVPMFFPRWPIKSSDRKTRAGRAFSFAQYRRNHEWQAALGFLLLLSVLLVTWRLRLF
jgi:protein-S-isoprenylcysteine O-methyltransferase Ste14